MTQIEQVKAEIERLLNSFPKPHGEVLPIDQNSYNLLCDLKLFIESLPVKHQSDNLEEAASRYAKEEYSHKSPATLPDRCKGCYAPLMYAFKDGANWQKEQMMKSAIDAIITSRWKGSHVCLTTNKDIPQIYNGDRVKIQIIKEAEQ